MRLQQHLADARSTAEVAVDLERGVRVEKTEQGTPEGPVRGLTRVS